MITWINEHTAGMKDVNLLTVEEDRRRKHSKKSRVSKTSPKGKETTD